MSDAASWLPMIKFFLLIYLNALGCIDETSLIIGAGCHRWPLLEVVIFNLPLLVVSGFRTLKSDTLTTIILLDVVSKSGEAIDITVTAQVLSEHFHGRTLTSYVIGSGTIARRSSGCLCHRRLTFIFHGHLFPVFA